MARLGMLGGAERATRVHLLTGSTPAAQRRRILTELAAGEPADDQTLADLQLTQAALGGEVEVPAIDGSRAKVKVPPGTQSGDQFRLRGKGFSVLRSVARGDMYIQVAVETPRNLTRRQRELLEEFEAEAKDHSDGSSESEGFFAKVASFFEGRS